MKKLLLAFAAIFAIGTSAHATTIVEPHVTVPHIEVEPAHTTPHLSSEETVRSSTKEERSSLEDTYVIPHPNVKRTGCPEGEHVDERHQCVKDWAN